MTPRHLISASQLSKIGVQPALGRPGARDAARGDRCAGQAARHGFSSRSPITTRSPACCRSPTGADVFVLSLFDACPSSPKGVLQIVHVLFCDIMPADHDWLQAHTGGAGPTGCRPTSPRTRSACALAHPFYSVDAAPLTPEHRRRLARMFPVWGDAQRFARAQTSTSRRLHTSRYQRWRWRRWKRRPRENDLSKRSRGRRRRTLRRSFPRHVQNGRARACGDQGTAAKRVHAAVAIAARTLGDHVGTGRPPDPERVMELVDRLMREAQMRARCGERDRRSGSRRRARAAARVPRWRRARTS